MGLLLVVAGLALLVIASRVDQQSRDAALWPDAVFVADGDAPWPGAIRTWVRRVPVNNFPLQREIYDSLKRVLPPREFNSFPLDHTEWFLAIDLPPAAFEPLLDSGRLPRKGTDEVLAGAFARAEFVQVDDGAFRVVGRLKRGVGGLASAYVLPGDDVWEPLWFSTASLGWFDPNGLQRIRDMDDPAAFIERFEVQVSPFPAPIPAIKISIAGLFVAALGGALLFVGGYGVLLRPGFGVFRPAARGALDHPRIVVMMHLALYGTFFTCTAFPLAYPYASVFMQEFIDRTFSPEGSLGYVGAAYESGNVVRATFATWVNNFLLQTAGLTMLLSVVVPMLGVLKTFVSLAIAGLAMTPVWAGMPGLFVFHSVTMILELEAYIFACIAVCVFWLKIARGIREYRLPDAAHEALMMLLSATLLAGFTLGVAALYEATTLLLLA